MISDSALHISIIRNIAIAVILILLFNTANAQNDKTPECFARVGNIANRNVQKKAFGMQQGVIAYVKINASHWEPIVVNNFSLIIFRDSSVVFQYKNNGNRFESSVRSAFQRLESNDTILIFSIHTRLADGKSMFLEPLEFKIE